MQPGLLAPSTLLHQRYCIEKQVGTGGFGAVYKARDTLFSHRLVAIKEMNQSGLSPRELAEASAAFQHEALFLAGLAHPHLPRIHDQFSEQGRSYMVMDFIDGYTLEEYLEKIAPRLPLEEVLDIGLQLCSALDYLHTRQPPLIFRDLKPANVMRTSDGHVYLIDFGIARHFQPGKAKDIIPLGSQGYAAPEQYGKTQTTPQTDIYGLGALLHQLVTGHDPSLTPFRFALVRTRQSPVSGQFDALLKEMLAMEMSKRPASMTVVREHLQRLLAQQTAKQLSPLQQSQSLLVKRRSFGCWLATGLFVLTTAGSTVVTRYALQYFAARTHLLPPDTTTPSTRATPTSGTINALSLTVPLYTYRGHKGTVTALSWSPNGHWIASAGVLDQTVQVWDAATGEPTIINAPVSDDNGDVGPRLPRSMPMLATFSTAPERVDTLAWASDSVRLASALGNNAVQLRDMTNGALISTTFASPGNTNTLAWSPDASRIASISDNSSVVVWSATTGQTLLTYNGHAQPVLALGWSPDGAWIASAGADGTVRVWHSTTGFTRVIYRRHAQQVLSLSWSPNGQWIASGSVDLTVQLWEAMSGTPLLTYRGHSAAVNAVAWSPNVNAIASGSTDATVQVWSILQLAQAGQSPIVLLDENILIYRGHTDQVLTLAWSPDGKCIASGSADATVQVWQAVQTHP
jgi:eukaryotic-like serine/threonine-protein kinase